MTAPANAGQRAPDDAVAGMTDSELVQLFVRRFGYLPLLGRDLNDLFAVATPPLADVVATSAVSIDSRSAQGT